MTSAGVSVLKNVVFVVTRNPAALACLIAATASSKTPSLSTDSSWRSLQPVDVHHPGEVAVRGELVQVLGQQQRVGAQEDDLLAAEQLPHDLVDLRVHQRFAAGDRDHRGAALLDRGHRLLDRHALLEQRRRLGDLSAARALEVAGEQRLQLDEERELVVAAQLLLDEIGAEPHGLAQRHGHRSAHLLGQRELHVLRGRLGLPDGDRTEPGDGPDEFVDEARRGGSAGRDADPRARRPPRAGRRRPVRRRAGRCTPSRSATSTRRTELDELGEPTTSSRSQSRAMARTACCRLVVA